MFIVFTYFVTGHFIQQEYGTIFSESILFPVGLPGAFGSKTLCLTDAVKDQQDQSGNNSLFPSPQQGVSTALSRGLKGWGREPPQVLLKTPT